MKKTQKILSITILSFIGCVILIISIYLISLHNINRANLENLDTLKTNNQKSLFIIFDNKAEEVVRQSDTSCRWGQLFAKVTCDAIETRVYATKDIDGLRQSINSKLSSSGWNTDKSMPPGEYFFTPPNSYWVALSQLNADRQANDQQREEYLRIIVTKNAPSGKDYQGTHLNADDSLRARLQNLINDGSYIFVATIITR